MSKAAASAFGYYFVVGLAVITASHHVRPLIQNVPEPWGSCLLFTVLIGIVILIVISWKWLEQKWL